MFQQTANINITENHKNFCKEVAKLCRKYGLLSFQGSFSPGIGDAWHSKIEFNWESGRHNSETGIVHINSQVWINAEIDEH